MTRSLLVARFARVAAAFALLLVVLPASSGAQVLDSARAAVRKPAADSAVRQAPGPPLSPRRAFLYSLLLPGYGQSVLGRPGAGALFVFTESIAIAMLRESKADLNQARRLSTDSLVFLGTDPQTGNPITGPSTYNDNLVNIRRSHVEDWIAFLIANHLFAAADAYVAANLWDLPTQVSVRQGPAGGTVIAARLRF